jgi:erythromycin esterase
MNIVIKLIVFSIIGLFIGIVIVPTLNGNELTYKLDQDIKSLDKSYFQTQYYSCTIEVTGEIKFNFQPIHLPVGEKSFIIYCSITFIPKYCVTVSVDDDIFNYNSGGKMYIVGFFGMYTFDDEGNNGKKNIHLDGKALYISIEAEQNIEIDDYFIPIVQSLDNIIYSIDEPPLEIRDEDLESLAYLSDSKIVGLGEATHGTKEFFQMKHRIFKYLVENHDFKVFAFECDMGESYYVNNYIINGEGDIDDLMINTMHFWTWRTEEVKELLVWMKEYNEDKIEEDKIYFIGVDCQFLTYQADIIIDYINNSNITLPSDCHSFLQEINQIGENIYDFYETISIDKKNEIHQNTDKLLTKIEEFRDELINASSEFEYQFIKQIALNIKQVNNVQYSYNKYGEINYRDLYMAENTLWTNTLFEEDNKVALWAHNMHVSNVEWYQSIGFHLKKQLNESYQIIDFGFSFGSFTASNKKFIIYDLCTNYITRQPLFGSINYVCHYSQNDNFILKKTDIQEDSNLDMWFSESHSFLDIGALFNGNSYDYYYDIKFKEHCDVLIYWDETTASELLNT